MTITVLVSYFVQNKGFGYHRSGLIPLMTITACIGAEIGWTAWRAGGLRAVAEHWRAFFKHEPGAEVDVHESPDETRLEVRVCPAIRHLRADGREIVPVFCQHCYFVNEAVAEQAGLTVRVSGGNGCCTQRFMKRELAPAPQNLEDIATAA